MILVPDPAMHRFILDCTATEYFSNLVWFIRNHVLDLDSFIRNNREYVIESTILYSIFGYFLVLRIVVY